MGPSKGLMLGSSCPNLGYPRSSFAEFCRLVFLFWFLPVLHRLLDTTGPFLGGVFSLCTLPVFWSSA